MTVEDVLMGDVGHHVGPESRDHATNHGAVRQRASTLGVVPLTIPPSNSGKTKSLSSISRTTADIRAGAENPETDEHGRSIPPFSSAYQRLRRHSSLGNLQTPQNRHRYERSASQESLEDYEEHISAPMETLVRNSPRSRLHNLNSDRTSAAGGATGGLDGDRNEVGHGSIEFWSKSAIRRRRRSSVSSTCPYPDLLEMTRNLRSNITIGSKRRVLFGVKHKGVFNGKVATNFLLKYICQDQDDPEAARDVGTWMLREQHIIPVSGVSSSKAFSSSQHALYRFNDALLSPFHLHVVVHAADNLLGKRNDGTSYPFAVIEACGQVGSTQVLSNTLAPVWNEKFIYGLHEYDPEWSIQATSRYRSRSPLDVASAKSVVDGFRETSMTAVPSSTGGSSKVISNRSGSQVSSRPKANHLSSANMSTSLDPRLEKSSSQNSQSNASSSASRSGSPNRGSLFAGDFNDDDGSSLKAGELLESAGGAAVRCTVWTEKVPFLQQHKRAFLGTVHIPWQDIPYIEHCDKHGLASEPPQPLQLKLERRSLRSRVQGTITVSAYVTRFHDAPYLRTRCHASPIVESDPSFQRSEISRQLDGKLLLPKPISFSSNQSKLKNGSRANESSRYDDTRRAKSQIFAALKVADYIMWDLVIDLASLNDVDFIGIAQDLKVASALLLPGMSWKQRVIAHIRSPTKHTVMLPSDWILRSQSIFATQGDSGQRRPGLIKLERLSADDIESSILHLRVRQDNTWSLDKTVSAGRELGRTAEFALASLPRLIVSPGDDTAVAPAYLEYRMTAYTSLAKRRRTPNGSIRAALYLVPSALRKDDEAIARQLSREELNLATCSLNNSTPSSLSAAKLKGTHMAISSNLLQHKLSLDTKETGAATLSQVDTNTVSTPQSYLNTPHRDSKKGRGVGLGEVKHPNTIHDPKKESSYNMDRKNLPRDLVSRVLSRDLTVFDITMRAPFILLHHYIISGNSLFMSMYLGREGHTSVYISDWEPCDYDFDVDLISSEIEQGRSGQRKMQKMKESVGTRNAHQSNHVSDADDSATGYYSTDVDYNIASDYEGFSYNYAQSNDADSEADNVEKQKLDEVSSSTNSSQKTMRRSTRGAKHRSASNSLSRQESEVSKNRSSLSYTRQISWNDKLDGSMHTEVQVVRLNVDNCTVVDLFRSGSGTYSKNVWMRLSLESKKNGVTNICVTCARGTSRSALKALRSEGQNMYELLQTVVAHAGVQQMVEKVSNHNKKSINRTYSDWADMSTMKVDVKSHIPTLIVVLVVMFAILLKFYPRLIQLLITH